MTRRLTVGGPFVAALALMLLSGCTNGIDDATAAPTATSSASAEPSASASPTPDAAPAATCDTVLSAEGYQKLSDDGLEPTTAGFADTLAERMIDAGGLACSWGKPQTDIVLTVVQLDVSSSAEATWSEALAAEGFVAGDSAVAGEFTGPVDGGSGLSPVAVLAGGTLTFVSVPAFASMLAPSS